MPPERTDSPCEKSDTDWREVDDPDMRRVLDVLAKTRDENERLRLDAISAYGQAQDAYEQLQRLRAYALSLEALLSGAPHTRVARPENLEMDPVPNQAQEG